MARLPVPGGDENTWGNVLNEYLAQSHNADGTLKAAAVNDVVGEATDSVKGVIQLAGDLGGTAAAPAVPGLTAHLNDTTDAHDASAISFAPTGTINATDAQTAIAEVASDAAAALAAHTADATTHGGTELAIAQIASNFTTTSTSYVDVPGGSITFTVPNRPYVVEAQLPVVVTSAGVQVFMKITNGSASVNLAGDSFSAVVNNESRALRAKVRVPKTGHAPTAGTEVTYKVQISSSSASSSVIVFVDFGGIVNDAWISAIVQ